ncbi:MAG: hypothetical protein AAF518_09975 [Spirochaetota bacterium]
MNISGQSSENLGIAVTLIDTDGDNQREAVVGASYATVSGNSGAGRFGIFDIVSGTFGLNSSSAIQEKISTSVQANADFGAGFN